MNADDQEALTLLLRQILVDTASNIFGIVDGISELGSFSGKLDLVFEEKVSLRGDLQALLLERDEEERT